jgi:hypothetical protein
MSSKRFMAIAIRAERSSLSATLDELTILIDLCPKSDSVWTETAPSEVFDAAKGQGTAQIDHDGMVQSQQYQQAAFDDVSFNLESASMDRMRSESTVQDATLHVPCRASQSRGICTQSVVSDWHAD